MMEITKEAINLEERIEFPNLNGLRFIAALMVIVNHIEIMKAQNGLANYSDLGFIRIQGGLGVTLFFVLSGFLITFLLLKEKEKFLDISVKAFYVRRVLRIWPLYYLIVFSGFFLLPCIEVFRNSGLQSFLNEDLSSKLLLFLLIMPNIAYVVFAPIPFLSPTWSIGVEEQFYLVWPLLLKYTSRYLEVFLAIVVLFFLLTNSVLGAFLESINRVLGVMSQQGANELSNELNDFLRILE